jgi:hypothetical protein
MHGAATVAAAFMVIFHTGVGVASRRCSAHGEGKTFDLAPWHRTRSLGFNHTAQGAKALIEVVRVEVVFFTSTGQATTNRQRPVIPTRRMIDRSRWCEGLKDPVAGGNGRDAVGFAE